jgi:AcrR family transcriptional regulator
MPARTSRPVAPRSRGPRVRAPEATRERLVTAAFEEIHRHGYQGAALDTILANAGVTKGALYHHFSSKRDLFAAVFAGEQERLSEAIVAAYQRREDSWEAFEAGAAAFVEACQEPGAQRIFLLDAPSALGWETIRRLESGSLQMMEQGIRRAIETGSIEERPVEPLAHLLFGALCESAMVVARAPDQRAALDDALAELHRMLASLSSSA